MSTLHQCLETHREVMTGISESQAFRVFAGCFLSGAAQFATWRPSSRSATFRINLSSPSLRATASMPRTKRLTDSLRL